MTSQPKENKATALPPTMSLGPGRQIFRDSLMTGLSDEQKRWAYLLSGERDLALLCALSRSSHKLDQEILDEWKNLWLIDHQDTLWIYDFSKDEQRAVFEHLKMLRIAGYYPRMFAAFDESCAREEWGW